MNVNDVEVKVDSGDMLEAIFKRQEELEQKYRSVEERQGVGYGLLNGQEFNIDHIRSQELLKNFAWRVVEELTEATDAHDRMHFVEELIDALHFLVSLALVVDLKPSEIVAENFLDKLEYLSRGDGSVYGIIQQIGLAMNCLKQKPWKQTHILTDTAKLKTHIQLAFYEFMGFCRESGISPTIVYEVYFKKNTVNHFRLRSGY